MYRVLIIDDDKLARKGLISIVPWEQCGFVVVGDVANGALALDFIEHNEVDLAVVDLTMPVLSGLDFIRECKLRNPEIKYVILSAHESFDYIQKALRLGVFDYISKLRLDQEDCMEIFGRIAAQMKLASAREGDAAGEENAEKGADGGADFADRDFLEEKGPISCRCNGKKEFVENFCEKLDRLACIYNGEMLEEMRRSAALAGLNAKERYGILLNMLHRIGQSFEVKLAEQNYDHMDPELFWMTQMREDLLEAVRGKSNPCRLEVLVLKGVNYIAENLTSHQLKAESVADAINMSRSYFSTSFKKYTGYSVNGYIRKERVELAKKLLVKDSKSTFADISYQVGYRDEKYFAKVFQGREGITFSEYRRRLWE